jgi:hypothetical protein
MTAALPLSRFAGDDFIVSSPKSGSVSGSSVTRFLPLGREAAAGFWTRRLLATVFFFT